MSIRIHTTFAFVAIHKVISSETAEGREGVTFVALTSREPVAADINCEIVERIMCV